mgnify:CR=1 FL=1
MKKILSVAIVLVMALVCLTACSPKLAAPVGTYVDEYDTNVLTFGAYDEKENTLTLTISNKLNDENVIKGTCTIEVNDPELPSYIVVFTNEAGEVSEYVYDASIDLVQGPIGGSLITYYGANYVEPAPVAE